MVMRSREVRNHDIARVKKIVLVKGCRSDQIDIDCEEKSVELELVIPHGLLEEIGSGVHFCSHLVEMILHELKISGVVDKMVLGAGQGVDQRDALERWSASERGGKKRMTWEGLWPAPFFVVIGTTRASVRRLVLQISTAPWGTRMSLFAKMTYLYFKYFAILPSIMSRGGGERGSTGSQCSRSE